MSDRNEYMRKYRKENKDRLSKKKGEMDKRYYLKHRLKILKKVNIYRQKNKSKISKKRKVYYDKNKSHLLKYCKDYYKENRNILLMRSSDYFQKNKNKIYAYYEQRRRKDIKFSLDERIRGPIRLSLKGNKIGRKWETLVGYTVEQLKKHIQKKFTKGMTWAKFMAGEIHIDHVVPRSHFKYTTHEDPQFRECWALHNLQPLWAKDNREKGNRNYQIPLPL